MRAKKISIPISEIFKKKEDVVWCTNYNGGIFLSEWMIELLKEEYRWEEDHLRNILILKEKRIRGEY